MKKILVASAVMFSALCFAQIDFSSTRFGVTGGLNYSRIKNAHNPSGPLYTFQAGGLALIPIGNDDQFYIQPELTYYGGGETGKDKNAKNASGYNAVYSNSYISVPLYFKGYFSEAESEFFAMAGPRFSFLVNQSVKDAPLRYTVEGDPNLGINGKASPFNLALSGGVGFSYKRTMEVALRYDGGLSNVYPDMIEGYTKDPNTEKRKTEQVVSVVVSYIFK